MSKESEKALGIELTRAIARLRAWIMATTFGLAGGVALTVATVWLLLGGGRPMGPHLALLSNFFPGYSVTWPGAAIGFIYGVVVGAIAGGALALVYNWIADARRTD